MLRPCAYQAQGLQQLLPACMPSVVAMVSHHDPKAEHALLTGLCSAWHALGYRVAVLDGMTAGHGSISDPAQSPLHVRPRTDDAPANAAHAPRWTAVPASERLQHLVRSAQDGLWLADWLRPYDVVVVYAPSDLLVSVIGALDAQTLLPVSPDATSILTAYQAMKNLLQASQLQPLLVTPIHAHACPQPILERVNQTLRSCAEQFLGHRLPVVTAHTLNDHDAAPQDLIGLALRLLEQAPAPSVSTPEAALRMTERAGTRILQRSH